jgi:Glycosyltransferase
MTVTAIFQDTGWSLGDMYAHIAPHIGGVCFEWSKLYDKQLFVNYDRVLTLAGDGSKCLVEQYGVPREKILVVAHAEQDVQRLLKDGNVNIQKYAGFGVVSDTLACSSLSIGITRVPSVLRQGIDCEFYKSPIPERLQKVGYAALLSRPNEYGVEIKRGELVRRAVEVAGLDFVPAIPSNRRIDAIPRARMPAYYRSVDALVMSSLQEGGAMPPYEAAAAGRLVIGTPVGDFPRLCLEGMGLLAPLNDEAFVEYVSSTLLFYKKKPLVFQDKCYDIAKSAKKRDWKNTIEDWIAFVIGNN